MSSEGKIIIIFYCAFFVKVKFLPQVKAKRTDHFLALLLVLQRHVPASPGSVTAVVLNPELTAGSLGKKRKS